MFGYVQAYKPELKLIEFDTYKAVYCSLCRQLGKSYGPFAKMILSYDFTFLAMLRLGLQDDCIGYKKMRCPFNPLVKCNRIKEENEELIFAASAVTVLFYYKMKDTIRDSGFLKKCLTYLIFPWFAHARKKAAVRYPDLDRAAFQMMNDQVALESAGCKSLDEASHPTSALLSAIFTRDEPDGARRRILSRLGYCLGKWIYLMDALDDLEEDMKSGNYNAIQLEYGLKSGNNEDITAAKEKVRSTINVCTAETASALELLDLKRYQSILSNIVYLGMPDRLKKTVTEETK